MRFLFSCLATNFAALGFVHAQAAEQLSTALAKYDDVSVFRTLLSSFPQILQSTISSQDTNITVLVPTNDAVRTYLTKSGVSDVTELSSDDVKTFFSYQTMVAALKSADFAKSNDMVVPTMLQGQKYNNRTVGQSLKDAFGSDATGQVVVTSGTKKSARRDNSQFPGPVVTVRSGLAQDTKMIAFDGEWGPKNSNVFQIIEGVLAPPRTCSTTIQSQKKTLSSLDVALNRTNLYPALNTAPNVTCLAPTMEAFDKAGNPETKLSKDDLTSALLAHTLAEVTYTHYLKDKMILKTMEKNTIVQVSVNDTGIYFNNSKVVKPNVLTNNGLIHILDAVMQPVETVASGSSNSDGGNASATTTSNSSPSESNAAGILSIGYHGMISCLVGIAIF